MNEKKFEECRKSFETHKATLIQDTDRYLIIDWRREDGSSNYYVNYIVDKKRGSLIVSGDLGDSIATWYNPVNSANLKNWVYNDIGYYISKMQCASDIYYCTGEDIAADIKSHISECDTDMLVSAYNEKVSPYIDVETEDELWEALASEADDCIYNASGDIFVPSDKIVDFCNEFDSDYYEWLYKCGRRISPRVYLWAAGFYMACEQLGI